MLNRLLFSRGGKKAIKLTLTAGEWTSARKKAIGFNSSVNQGSLTPNTFQYNGITYTIYAFYTRSGYTYINFTTPTFTDPVMAQIKINGVQYTFAYNVNYQLKGENVTAFSTGNTYNIEILSIT